MTKKKKKIAILGCGWVGNSVKESLQEQGHEVNCLCRDVNMDTLVGFYDCDTLIIAIPPSDEYLDVIEDAYFSISLNEALLTQVIFLSSVSFYEGKKIIIEAEELAKIKDENTVILRLGGLMGYDRIAGKSTQGKTTEDGPTNYVHRDDVVGIIGSCIEQNIKNKIFDVVAPKQTSKKEIFTQNSKQFNFKPSVFTSYDDKKKSLSSDILCEVLGYTFKKEDVRHFWDEV
jgi:nucleoside-diphosphate-sugar epimerase